MQNTQAPWFQSKIGTNSIASKIIEGKGCKRIFRVSKRFSRSEKLGGVLGA